MKINIRDIAKKLNIEIIEKPFSDNLRGSAFKVNDKWFIAVNQLDPEERKNFTIAHELAEIELATREDLSDDEKHNLANIKAAEKLLPERSFKNDMFKFNLYQLKKLYPQASYEVIARRILDYKNAVLTIFDNFSKTIRIGSRGINFPQFLLPEEKKVVKKCYNLKGYSEKEKDNISIKGYYIDEGRGVKRVIMLTEIDE